jgi:hypothetical protein
MGNGKLTESITERQNEEKMLRLLHASAVAYGRAKLGENLVTLVLLMLSVAYPVCYIFIPSEDVKMALFGCSFLLTVIILVFGDRFKGNTTLGALFKEEFDIELFRMGWKSTLKRPERADVLHYARRYRGNGMRDWYSRLLSPALDDSIAVAVLQHSNTSYDIRLRKLWREILLLWLILYSIALLIVFILINPGPVTVFYTLFSLLSFYTHFINLCKGHAEVISKREAISRHLDEIIRRRRFVSLAELRDIQDEIYLTRREPAKVPDFFFRLRRKSLNAEIEDYIEEVNRIYAEERRSI